MESNILVQTEPCSCVASVRSPRVLAVIPGSGEGMSFIFARRQVASLAETGVDIEMFYLRSRRSLRELLGEWYRLRKTVRRYSPDLIHAQYGTITSFLCACSSLRPLAVTFRGSDLNSDPSLGFARRGLGFLFSQLSALRASAIICVSERLSGRLWWGKNKAVVVPSGVNLALFRPMDKEQCRRTIGWGKDAKVILFNAGRSPLLKGVSLAREAAGLAERMVGPVELFELHGEISPKQIPLYLNAADCLLLTSQYEGSPNIVKEAVACNLPVVSVDVGDVAERLKGVHPSCIVARDPGEIAKAVEGVLALGLRSNGSENIAHLSEAQIAKQICSIYNSILYSRQQVSTPTTADESVTRR